MVIINKDKVEFSTREYSVLSLVASLLSRSRFLDMLCLGNVRFTEVSQAEASRLKRRLNKVRQYYNGMNDLIKEAKRRSQPGTPIASSWVDFTVLPQQTGDVRLPSMTQQFMESTCKACKVTHDTDIWAKIQANFPNLVNNWQRREVLHTTIHCEIRVICSIDRFLHQ